MLLQARASLRQMSVAARQRLGFAEAGARDVDQEQAHIRVIIGAAVLIYALCVILTGGALTPRLQLTIVAAMCPLCAGLWMTYRFRLHAERTTGMRYFGICADLIPLTIGLWGAGEPGVPLIGVYLWVTVGNGFRFGPRYLLFSYWLSALCFSALLVFVPFWQEHRGIGIGFAMVLATIPLYVLVLLSRLTAQKDAALELSNAKSRFVANVSHELRTPLTGVFAVYDLLRRRRLATEDRELVGSLGNAITTLKASVDAVLQMSKLEAGAERAERRLFNLRYFLQQMGMMVRPQAAAKQLTWLLDVDSAVPATVVGDPAHLQHILGNLLNNAFKFTPAGGVTLRVTRGLSGVRFEVSDTGIGIPAEKQKLIFEAFQQADASTSRKYGGTGLGLAISRELSNLLGGEIQLRSTPGTGSTFKLFLPVRYVGAASVARPALPTIAVPVLSERIVEQIMDDREHIAPDDTLLLIVEDDPHYARILMDIAHEEGFKVITAARGEDALELAEEYNPAAVSLDIFLPDMLGWTVMSQLKKNAKTRHIPVQIITLDEDRQHALARGAFSFVPKPTSAEGVRMALSKIKAYVQPRRKRLLVVEDNPAEQLSISALLEHSDIEIVSAGTGKAALKILRKGSVDCVVLDLRLPDMSGFELLDKLSADPALADVPVIVFTGRELSAKEESQLHSVARSIVVKGVESPERLLDETALFLHRNVTDLPREKQLMLEKLTSSDDDLLDKTVLLVDDDARNIFALSSALERRGMRVLTATTGMEAIELVHSTPELAIVLMDIMMPEMDGYETMQVMRQNGLFRRLPIIALTAKAMKGDREKCLEAGASEYLAKPVNTEQLLSALRIWLHR
jgi:CheY-like chemotaxis protein/signal transduction histidine kinase